ncbi:GNAT family N-acetyltransferase [Sphingomonas sabuli]|nr:GNAT family N-acetyltransferase [Sphingomonas sabuli]
MRRARACDLSAIHAIMSDAEVMRFWSTPPHVDLSQTEAWLAGMIAADAAHESDEFVIEYDGVVIGKLGTWRPPELGFIISRHCWGRGFAKEALQAYIKHVKRRGSDELTADVDPRNAACLRLLEKCGFVETGRETATYVVNGRPCDSVYLQLDVQLYAEGEKRDETGT